MAYEAIQNYSKKQSGSDVSLAVTLFAGGSAGIGYWLVGMPADVLKSRLQTGKKTNLILQCVTFWIFAPLKITAPEGTYKNGIRSVFKELMVKDGPLALYRGITPIMIRAFPANAACFFGIELANKFFDKFFPNF